MNITPDELLTELLLLSNANSSKAIIVVEGQTDKKLMSSLFNNLDNIEIIAAGTQSLVVDSMSILSSDKNLQKKLPPTKGIIDRDYLIPLGAAPNNQFIIMTDSRDIECMMIESKVFEIIMQEYIDLLKSKKHNINNPNELRIAAINICRQVGAVRYWSQSTKTNISFKSLDFSKILKKNKPIEIDVPSFIKHIQGAQKGKTISETQYNAAQVLHKTEKYFSHDYLICRGHDLIAVIGVFLKKWCGNNACTDINNDSLERMFRVGFPGHWNNTILIKTMKHWVGSIGLNSRLA